MKSIGRCIGGARASNCEWNLRLQMDAMLASDCAKGCRGKKIAGTKRERPGLETALKAWLF